METDAFFYQLFNCLPQTLFELIGLPASRAKSYRFDSVELKKAFRIDGLFLPKRATMPLYFVEVQFQRSQKFYANLFAKAFSYLEENDAKQEWVAVAIFPTRKEEPKHLKPYEDLVQSQRVKRVFLEDIADADELPLGLGILQLLSATERQAQSLAPRITRTAEVDLADSNLGAKVVQLVEEMLLSRFPQYGREEVRMKFKLHDLRDSKVWKEAQTEKQDELRKSVIEKLQVKGMLPKEIAEVLDVPVAEVHRLAAFSS